MTYKEMLQKQRERKEALIDPKKGYYNVLWEKPAHTYPKERTPVNSKVKILTRKSKTNLSIFG